MSPNEMGSVLSHPDRTNSFHKTEDSVVVPGQGSTRLPKMPGGRSVFEVNADQVMENALKESQGWRYLKRKSTFTVNDSSKSKLKLAHHTASKRSPSPTTTKKVKPNSHKLRGTQARGFQLGVWEGSSAGWVAFENIIFSDHLVGLNYLQVEEYIRLRCETATEGAEDGSAAAEHAAAQGALRRVKEDPMLRRPGLLLDPLPGTRPTHILIGRWKPSGEADRQDRHHAVYGVWSENESFHVKVVRQTRDGRSLDGSYSSGPSIRWIYCDEIEFQSHLKGLNRQGLKEYCRVRQYQLDHGENSAERVINEVKAVYEAQLQTGTTSYRQHYNVTVPAFTFSLKGNDNERLNGRYNNGSHELRQSRYTKLLSIWSSLGGDIQHSSRHQSVEAVERALPRCDVWRAKVSQDLSRYEIYAN
ncbi:hypothetical protein H634G_11198 [Metarhizium anisopliae BRIP 53293]|uniref:Uncharacterized protein n=1 Tax=Metarhizium anisopliae BRIP 53293 TaxID=1291518 RepID=A0A0D9NHS2_METAN|nr:hypothetical protein H634G_11198 [Metarhizium anisopliae BRIP 53293]